MEGFMEPEERFAEVNGLRLHYLDWGSVGKPPVLLLHGLAMFARTWDHNALALRDAFHVLALDQRGHGESDRPPRDGYRTPAFASDVVALADALGWERFSIVGQSMGGHNAMFTAAERPDRVARLVISDMEPVMRRELIADMRGAERLPEYDSVEAAVAEARARNPRPTDELLRHRVEHMLRRLPDGRLTPKYDLWAPKSWQALDLWPRLADIRCPTLLVRGAESPVLQPDVAERMVRAIPDCRYVEIPRAAHSVGLDNPAAFDAAVRAFLLGER
jgi:esterase